MKVALITIETYICSCLPLPRFVRDIVQRIFLRKRRDGDIIGDTYEPFETRKQTEIEEKCENILVANNISGECCIITGKKKLKDSIGSTLFCPLDFHLFEPLTNLFLFDDNEKLVLPTYSSKSSLCSGSSSSSNDVLIEYDFDLYTSPRILTQSQIHKIRRDALPVRVGLMKWIRAYSLTRDGVLFRTMLDKCAPFDHTLVAIKTTTGDILGGYADSAWIRGSTSRSDKVIDESRTSRSNLFCGGGQCFLFATNPYLGPYPNVKRKNSNSNNTKYPSRSSCIECRDIKSTSYIRGHDNSIIDVVPSSALNIFSNEYVVNKHQDSGGELLFYKWTGQNNYSQICDISSGSMGMGGGGSFGWYVQDDFTLGSSGSCSTFDNPPLVGGGMSHADGYFHILDFEIYGFRGMSASDFVRFYSTKIRI